MMVRFLRHPALWLLASLTWLAALWYFSSQPGGSGPQWNVPHADKILHFICFSGGGFFIAGCIKCLGGDEMSWPRAIRLTILISAGLGWLDEWHQCRVPGRSGADPWDWLADVLGGTTGATAVLLLHHGFLFVQSRFNQPHPRQAENADPSPAE